MRQIYAEPGPRALSTARLYDYRRITTASSIRKFMTKFWRKSDLYIATKLTLNAFALSLDDLADIHHRCGGGREVDRHATRLREQATISGDSPPRDSIFCMTASSILTLVLEDDQLARSGVEVGNETRSRIANKCEEIHPFANLLLKMRTLSRSQEKSKRRSEPLSKHSEPLLGVLREVCKQAHVTLASTVILQLYLDVADTTAPISRDHVQSLLATARRESTSLARFDELVSKMDEKPTPSKKVRQAGTRCRRLSREVLALDAALPKVDWDSPADLCPALMLRSPVFCGSVLVSLMESSYVHAMYACQYESKVTAAAHLYCASRLAGRLDLWTDVISFIGLQGASTLGLVFFRGRSCDTIHAAMGVSIALGVPRGDFVQQPLMYPPRHQAAFASLHGWKCFRVAGIPVHGATIGTGSSGVCGI